MSWIFQVRAAARIHNIFHVSLLKVFKGEQLPPLTELPPMEDGQVVPLPAAVIRGRANHGKKEVLIQWAGVQDVEATWEDVDSFQQPYPSFELENKLFQREGVTLWMRLWATLMPE